MATGISRRAIRRRYRPSIAFAALTASLLVAACSDVRSTGGGEVETQGQSAEEMANLEQAWSQDFKALGLQAQQPPTGDIEVVNTEKYEKEGPYRIAFASQGPTNSWALSYDETLNHAAETTYKDDVEEILYADANGDADKQVSDIEDLVAQQPDALIVTPLGSAVKAPIERAASQGIPVILCTGQVDTESYVTRVDRDNTLNGTLMAEWVAEQIDGKGDIIMLSGIPGVPTAVDRLAAARDVFKKYPDINILGHEYTNWSPTESKQVMESLLVKFPNVDAIWSDSGINDIGVIQAYREAGKDIPPMSGEPLNGFLRLAQEENVPFAAIGYPPYHSERCLQAAIDTLHGEPQPRFINVDAAVFTDERIGEFYMSECSDDLWVPPELPTSKLEELKLC
ncbi:MAG: ABC transporter substrate-binding protein [Actinomycetota bacterium]|nr:ABC transporter substrate-binding protein [Actinomycetota bacterium]